MEKRICPVCDHAMKFSHYCHFCRSFVRRPVRVNLSYYLNERHPAHETDCEFHAPVYKKNAQQNSMQPSRAPAANRPFRPAVQNQPSQSAALGRLSGSGRPVQSQRFAENGRGQSLGRSEAGNSQTRKAPSILIVIGVSLILMFFFSGLLPFLLFLL